MDMERKYGNVGVLDIRDTSEDVFADQLSFGNIGVILFSKRTAPFLRHIRSGNIGVSQECTDDFQVIQGKSTLTSDAMKDLKSPLNLLVMGKLVIQDEVSAEALAKGVGMVQVIGKILCPSDLLPVLQSKVQSLSGKIDTYPSGYRLVSKSLRLDRTQLLSYPPSSKLAVFGDVIFDANIPKQVLSERLASLYVRGDLSIPETLLETVQPLLHPQMSADIHVIPDGFEPILDDVQVGQSELVIWQGAKLYFAGSVRFSSDVLASDINRLEAFISIGEVFCKESLLSAVVKKCDRFKTRFMLYKDHLLFNEGQTELTIHSFPQSNEKLTVVNNGVINVSPEVSQEILRERLDAIRNSGVIFAAANQLGAIQEKAKDSGGPILVSSAADSDPDFENSGTRVGNVGVLKL